MLRAMYNFEHCVKTPAPALGNVINPTPGFGYANATLLNAAQMAVGPDGFLGGYSSGGAVSLAFDMTGIVPPNPTKVTFGFRIKTLAAITSNHAVIAFSTPSAPNDTTAYMLLISSVAAPWMPTAGNEIYIEVTYDFATFSATAKVNGVQATITQGPAPSAGQKAAFVSGAWTFNLTMSTVTNARYAYRDIYVVDATAGDGMVDAIGPQKMFPISLDAAAGAGWVTSGGASITDTLNTLLPANPYATSPGDRTPLVTSLKSTVPVGSRVNAVSLSLSGTSTGDTASTSKVELTQNSVTSPAKFPVTPQALTYGTPIGLFPKAPDGTAWDLTKIDATTLKLTPDTSS